MYRFYGCEATNPLDQVYGLLGLVPDKDRISIDYGISGADMFATLLCTASKYGSNPNHGRFALVISKRLGLNWSTEELIAKIALAQD